MFNHFFYDLYSLKLRAETRSAM